MVVSVLLITDIKSKKNKIKDYETKEKETERSKLSLQSLMITGITPRSQGGPHNSFIRDDNYNGSESEIGQLHINRDRDNQESSRSSSFLDISTYNIDMTLREQTKQDQEDEEDSSSPTFNNLQHQQIKSQSNQFKNLEFQNNYQSIQNQNEVQADQVDCEIIYQSPFEGVKNQVNFGSNRLQHISPNNYSFAQISGSNKRDRSIHEFQLAKDHLHQLNHQTLLTSNAIKNIQNGPNIFESQINHNNFKIPNSDQKPVQEFIVNEDNQNIFCKTTNFEANKQIPISTNQNLFEQSDFKFDLQKVMNEETTFRDNIETLRIQTLAEQQENPQVKDQFEFKEEEQAINSKQDLPNLTTDYVFTEEERDQKTKRNKLQHLTKIDRRTRTNKQSADEQLLSNPFLTSYTNEDLMHHIQEEKEIEFSSEEHQNQKNQATTQRTNAFDQLDELSQDFAFKDNKENNDEVILKHVLIQNNQTKAENKETPELKQNIKARTKNPMLRKSRTSYGQSYLPTKNKLFDSLSNLNEETKDIELEYSQNDLKRTNVFRDEELLKSYQQEQINRTQENDEERKEREELEAKIHFNNQNNMDLNVFMQENQYQSKTYEQFKTISSPLQKSVLDFQNRQRLNFRPQRPESARSNLSDNSNKQRDSNNYQNYHNPLSDEKDKGILRKSIHYKTGKMLVANFLNSPNTSFRNQNVMGRESSLSNRERDSLSARKIDNQNAFEFQSVASRTNINQNRFQQRPRTIDSHADNIFEEFNLRFSRR